MNATTIKRLQYRDKGGRQKLETEARRFIDRNHPHCLTGLEKRKAIAYIVKEFQNNPEPINNHFGHSYNNYLKSKKLKR